MFAKARLTGLPKQQPAHRRALGQNSRGNPAHPCWRNHDWSAANAAGGGDRVEPQSRERCARRPAHADGTRLSRRHDPAAGWPLAPSRGRFSPAKKGDGQQVRQYVDGKLEGISARRNRPPGERRDRPERPARRTRCGSAKARDGSHFHGEIDELFLADAALTPQDIRRSCSGIHPLSLRQSRPADRGAGSGEKSSRTTFPATSVRRKSRPA